MNEHVTVKLKEIPYNIVIGQYSGADILTANCNSILFLNYGATIVNINNVPVPPGGNFGIAGNVGEIDITQYSFNFTGVGSNLLIVVRKYYK